MMEAIGFGIGVAGVALAIGLYKAAEQIQDAVRHYVDNRDR